MKWINEQEEDGNEAAFLKWWEVSMLAPITGRDEEEEEAEEEDDG